MMQRLIGCLVVLLAFFANSLHATGNADGTLDANFATGGRRLIDVSNSNSDKGRIVRVQSGGKLLIGGTCGSASLVYFCATRLTAAGVVDLSFGPDNTGPTSDALVDMLSLSDGRILFLGVSTLAVLTADGKALDTGSAGGTGFTSAFGLTSGFGQSAMAEQVDHKILLTGYAPRNDASGNIDMSVQRLLPDLSVDTNFGTGGIQRVVFNLGFSNSVATSLALQANGNIAVAGYVAFSAAGKSVGVARLLPNGQLDPAFGGGGSIYQTPNTESVALAVRVDSRGRIVYAGYAATDTNFGTRSCLVNRLLANGSQDYTFNANQPLLFKVLVGAATQAPCELVDLNLQPDGTLLGVGSLADYYFTAVRLTPAGAFDPTFGNAGTIYGAFDASSTNSIVRAGALGIGSGLLIAGTSTDSASSNQFGIAQYTLTLHIFANGFDN